MFMRVLCLKKTPSGKLYRFGLFCHNAPMSTLCCAGEKAEKWTGRNMGRTEKSGFLFFCQTHLSACFPFPGRSNRIIPLGTGLGGRLPRPEITAYYRLVTPITASQKGGSTVQTIPERINREQKEHVTVYVPV